MNVISDISFRRAIVRGPVVSLASQATGVVQLGLILLRAGVNRDTDAYFYLFNVGLVPIMCVIVGMMYPSLLNERRMSRVGLAAIRRWTPPLCALFVVGGAGWLAARDRLPEHLYGLAVCGVVLAAVQARVWFRAVAAEAGGNPLWVSGIALVPNLFAVLALLPPWGEPSVVVTAMMVALLAGNLALLAVMRHRRVGQAILDAAPELPSARSGHVWFLAQSMVGYLAGLVLQSLAVLLPASGVTLLNVGVKIVGSGSAMFVNASMPVFLHQATDSPRAARRFLYVVVTAAALAGTVLVVVADLARPDQLVPAMALALWMVASCSQAIAFRLSYRFLAPRATARTMAVVLVAVALCVLSTRLPGFDLGVALCGYAMLDAASGFLLFLRLRERAMSVLLGAVVAGVAGVWISAFV